jgi:drug/metabolite transporter (DMT)-like permease
MMTASKKGILCMVAGGALITVNDAILKWLSDTYPVGEVMFVRGIFVSIPIVFLVWRAGGIRSLVIFSWRGHLLRAALVVTGTTLFINGLFFLPLADAIAITFTGPIFVTALAPLLLGEHVGWRRWSAVLVGFCGVLIMVRPTGEAAQWAALFPLVASLTGALRDIVTRRLAFRERSVALLFYTTVAVVLAGLSTLPMGWQPIAAGDLGLFALTGILIGSAHFLMIEAFRFAEAAVVSPFKYFNLIVAVILGFVVWQQLPDAWTLGGAVFVIASGLYILRRETVR